MASQDQKTRNFKSDLEVNVTSTIKQTLLVSERSDIYIEYLEHGNRLLASQTHWDMPSQVQKNS